MTYYNPTRDEPVISQLARLRRKSRANERSPVMAHHNTLPVLLQKQLPHTDYELRHRLEHLIRAIVWQAVATAISWQIDSDECMGLVKRRCLQDVLPQQIRVRKAVYEDSYVA